MQAKNDKIIKIITYPSRGDGLRIDGKLRICCGEGKREEFQAQDSEALMREAPEAWSTATDSGRVPETERGEYKIFFGRV